MYEDPGFSITPPTSLKKQFFLKIIATQVGLKWFELSYSPD